MQPRAVRFHLYRTPALRDATNAIKRLLGRRADLVAFNDAPRRKQREVVELLRLAKEAERARISAKNP